MTKNIDIDNLITDWYSGKPLKELAIKYDISAAIAKKYLNSAGISTKKLPGLSKSGLNLIIAINEILNEYETRLTVRQVYYQMASRNIVPLSKSGYLQVTSACNKGRKLGVISWDKIEDRTRQPKTPNMWEDKNDFFDTVLKAYRKNIWYNQPNYFEVWLEKNALSGIIGPITHGYGVTLQTITGYSSISAVYESSKRLKNGDTILYFGDHDATGIDIDRSLQDSFLDNHGINVDVKRIGLLYDDIEKYNLLPNPIKETDPRASKYPYEKQAELDALPPNVLIERLENAIVEHLDMAKFMAMKKIEKEELNDIV